MKATMMIICICLTFLSPLNGGAQEDAALSSDGILMSEGAAEVVEEAAEVTSVDATGTVNETGPVNVNNKICPVSGQKIGSMGEGATREYNGKIYSFCCPMCLNDFDLDPEKYVGIVEQMKAQEAAEGGGSDEEMTEPAVE